MKRYTFDIEGLVVLTLPGTMTVEATSFEHAVRLAQENWRRLESKFEGVEEDTLGSVAEIDLCRVSDGSREVELSWNNQEVVMDHRDLGALRQADAAAVLH